MKHSPNEWVSFTRNDIAKFITETEDLNDIILNPVWKMDLPTFVESGYVTGFTTPDEPSLVTQKFITAVSNQTWSP